ncbi:unnamed protein product [Linum trigynum]|uniref:Uncharacterized protein n=1 Tax=Linum trigynum TaxID=586398 RepID=A0AAV2D7N1_9ROSI
MKLVSVLSIVVLVLSFVTLHVGASRVVDGAREIPNHHCTTPIYYGCNDIKCNLDCSRHFGGGTFGWCWEEGDLCFCERPNC